MNHYKLELISSHIAPWEPKNSLSRQIAVLMSGGVDSSVTAHLLHQAGWDVLGITMRIPTVCRTDKRGCCGAEAAYVCAQLKLPHYFVDVTAPFNELIIDRFRTEYRRGRTPNPCADCNRLLKFTLMWDLVEKEFGIRHLATGHYAQVLHTPHGPRLRRGHHHAKDQSYFLYGIPRRRLADFVLPLGQMTKEEVRTIARNIGIGVAEKSESMELCFAGEGNYRAALLEGDKPGNLLDIRGNIIGTHKGIAHYTLGQRRGLHYAAGKPVYVAGIDAEHNTVTLGTREEISHTIITAGEVNILIPEQIKTGQTLFGKLRSYGPVHQCQITEFDDIHLTVRFEKPQFAPCPGQKLVLYNTDEDIVAGGTIEAFQ
ncbi:MAG TPA: tRNA 2-thiouridine(34) synthase MnmA [Anaerohalosphaeraceae bacterium]|nr:tRNA 2-thiouridine(34) synthase MnmA [Phycisphaerae bacterium]HOK96792.1 tRNA 2-thiouridine(34) synthase MnmA [Anaerohalosphaeraceae bacterium]HOL31948.1 tRNA 2-thiouridine(34) synthase MnmA [Anaerohalosphaeraceae bacterium]HOM76121.1 tRNA 2-thiouridine(34) synthase MnmA [Anaerohalosphaeraceae bacterium]HPC63741.1 tRNA 2-thiouridine(34) synthase MnmA [Anaerohalosphaeraceae bacterium]